METIESFPLRVTADDAVQILTESDTDMAAAAPHALLYYPYGIFEFEVQADALLNSFRETVVCAVDLINEKELLVDEQPTPNRRSVPPRNVLSTSHSVVDVESAARTYLFEITQQRLKLIRTPTLEVRSRTLLYRPFHVLECTTTAGDEYDYVVDGVSGEFHRIYINTKGTPTTS
ncbi:hypothetical protein [Halegenticoccus tardaugens]|uniref:hypothetical protein n=1 Tax=Halegenticoccus tardaugens TaxID=2071624 RepID=UPI00100B73BC|nr:hypothetical protein [Halegenticoccus tardaugens]